MQRYKLWLLVIALGALLTLLLVFFAGRADAHKPDILNLTSFVVATTDTTDSAAATATVIAGLQIPVLAAKNYAINCYVMVSAPSTADGIQLGVNSAITPTQVAVQIMSYQSVATAALPPIFETFASLTLQESGSLVSAGTTKTINEVKIILENGTTAGVIDITLNPDAAVTVQAYEGSWCSYQLLNP